MRDRNRGRDQSRERGRESMCVFWEKTPSRLVSSTHLNTISLVHEQACDLSSPIRANL